MSLYDADFIVFYSTAIFHSMGNCLTAESEARASKLPKSRFSSYIEAQKKLRLMKNSDESEDSIYSRHRSLILSHIHKDSPKADSTLNEK